MGITRTTRAPRPASTSWFAVYAGVDGKTCVGHIIYRGAKIGWEALDGNDESLGIFRSMKHAGNAVYDASLKADALENVPTEPRRPDPEPRAEPF